MIVKQTTISEVAEKAGVSTKTVSRVINNEEGVRESTARKVKKAIEVLNYKPNVFAHGRRHLAYNSGPQLPFLLFWLLTLSHPLHC